MIPGKKNTPIHRTLKKFSWKWGDKI